MNGLSHQPHRLTATKTIRPTSRLEHQSGQWAREHAMHWYFTVTLTYPTIDSVYVSPYLWNQLPSSFRQRLILFTLLLVNLILCISPHHSHHLCSHHLSLPQSFTHHLFHKIILSSIVTLIPSGLPSLILKLSGHLRLFVLVSSFSYFFWLRVLD